MLISLSLLRNLSPKNSLSICNTLEDFGQGAVEYFRPFSVSWWVFPLLCFAFTFSYTNYLVCGGFVVLLPRMRAFRSLVGF